MTSADPNPTVAAKFESALVCKHKLFPVIGSKLFSLSAPSQSFLPYFGPYHQCLGCFSTNEVMSGKKTPNRTMRDRLVRAEAVEICSQFLDAQKSVFFLTFLRRNLSSRVDSFLGLPDLGFGKTVPLATEVLHIVRNVWRVFQI